eukprot:m.203167 g.203167  ORF g.203167 m.203167 type:complete len:501 (-) comp14987_c2_seq6:1724-3226(-)
MAFKVKVKWNKQVFKDVELDTSESPELFSAQLFALTGVPTDRQKLMLKGKAVKGTWDGFKISDKSSFLLMGTAGELPEAPQEAVVFLEDLPEEQRVAASAFPPGLVNVGNTCYMNSTIQCLGTVPQLRQRLEALEAPPMPMPGAQPNVSGDPESLSKYLGQLYRSLSSASNDKAIQKDVVLFWASLRTANPQFAETHEGHPAQQDASECWGEVLRALESQLPADEGSPASSAVKEYFGIETVSTLTNTEMPEEEPRVLKEQVLQLSAHIEKDVGFIMAGLKKSMEGMQTAMSPGLGRDAVYSKKTEVARLPQFLTTAFVRFYYKQSVQQNCKISKEVKFPFTLDVYELCSPELKAKMLPARNKFAAYQDWEADQKAALAGKKEKKEGEDVVEYEPTEFADDPGSNNSGYYELQAVLTHRGRSSNSGHYVAWVKLATGQWVLFDDDTVTPQKPEDILRLSGGGGADWHTAYILLYGAQKCPKIPAEEAMDVSADADAGAAE